MVEPPERVQHLREPLRGEGLEAALDAAAEGLEEVQARVRVPFPEGVDEVGELPVVSLGCWVCG